MHGTNRTLTTLRFTRSTLALAGALAALAATALGYRFARAGSLGLVELATSIATAALVIGAVSAAWLLRVRKLRARAEMAEWEAARLRREELLDDDADAELWDSIPAQQVDEDTCEFGLNVVAINQWRYPRAG